jgi:serine protease inhibitor
MHRRWLLLASVLLVSACVGGSSLSPEPTAGPSPTAGSNPTAQSTSSPSPSAPAAGSVELVRSDLPRATVDPARAAAAADAMNAFGLDLYRRVASGTGNIVLSPASVAIALSMTRAGARGTTADEMDAVLRGLGSDALADAANALDAALAARSGTFADPSGTDREVSLRIANALFAQYDMPLEGAFLDAMATRYDAGAWLVDYRTDPEAARLAINDWVAQKTEDRIPSILGPGVVTNAWRLAIANAIYLKAAWLEPFPEDATAPGDFMLADGSLVQVPMMRALRHARYAAGDGWAAVQLPYVGQDLEMVVIVPDNPASFDATFDTAVLGSIVGSLDGRLVDLAFPKFDIEWTAELSSVLAGLGMPTAFGGAADFSGITAAERLAISKVIHQANITVDEAGTEAAAVTIVGMDTAAEAPEPVTLRVDRPFLFVLRDVPTGAVVFLGRVADPSETR